MIWTVQKNTETKIQNTNASLTQLLGQSVMWFRAWINVEDIPWEISLIMKVAI